MNGLRLIRLITPGLQQSSHCGNLAVHLFSQSKRIPLFPGKIGSCVTKEITIAPTMSDKNQYSVVFVLGGPGAGKGTQCEKIEEAFGFKHLSAGELLRQERNSPNSQYGDEIETHLKNGSIVPVKITCSLLKRAMDTSGKNKFLIDGFPRNTDNLNGWNSEMEGVAKVRNVLFFNCPDEVCVGRCLNRGLTSGRTDDNAESLKKRIETYRTSTMPIIDHYRKMNLVSEIDGNRSTDEVFYDVKKVFSSLDC